MAAFAWLSCLAMCLVCRTSVAVQVGGVQLAKQLTAIGGYFLGSDIAWTSCSAGGACRIDHAYGTDEPINIGGTEYPKGIWAHADSTVTFSLGGVYRTFSTCFGITRRSETSQCGNTAGNVSFIVVADGVELYRESGKVSGPATCISLDISGKDVLELQADDGIGAGDDGTCDHSAWGDAKVQIVDYLGSDVPVASCTTISSYPCAVDYAGQAAFPITIGGTEYPKGIWAHAPSTMTFSVGGNYNLFYTCFGIALAPGDPNCGTSMGEVTFTVLADGTQLYSEANKTSGAATCITLDVTGKMELELQADRGAVASCDHSAWGDAKLTGPTSSPTMSPTASPTTASPTVSPPETPTGVAAIGDPHLTNMRGRKLELHRTGNLMLLQIPKMEIAMAEGEAAESKNDNFIQSSDNNSPPLLLRVDAQAMQKGPNCAQSYIEAIALTGEWIKAIYPEGLRRYVADPKFADPTHRRHKISLLVGPGIRMVITHAKTDTGINYLNFRASSLEKAGATIGGLLGDSDESASDGHLPEACKGLSGGSPATAATTRAL